MPRLKHIYWANRIFDIFSESHGRIINAVYFQGSTSERIEEFILLYQDVENS